MPPDIETPTPTPTLMPSPALPEKPEEPGVTQASSDHEPLRVHVPVGIQGLSLAVLAIFAGIFVLHWAKAVFVPFMLGLLLSYALSPVVNWLERRRVPRWLGSAVLVISIVAALSSTAWSLSGEALRLLDSLPAAVQKFKQSVKNTRRGAPDSTLESVQKAATQIEQVTRAGTNPPTATSRGALRVVVEPPRFDITDYFWTGTLGLAAVVGQFTAVVFLTYFLMASGDTFRRKLLKLAGPRISSKKITLQALDEITGQIQRYLQVQLLTSALVGVLTGAALWAVGLENAAVWGIAAGVLNLVPYIGSLVTAVASAMVGFLQFGSLNMAMLVGGVSLVIHTMVGNLLTPWLTSRTSRMNPVAIFAGLLAWGWLWGVWGLLLGVPILMMVKSLCDRVDDLKPVGEFLGS